MLFGQEHVKRYVETDGEEGHDWQDGVPVLILTTTGRRSGEERPTPLIYGRHGDDYLVVASKGGAPDPPAWYLNLSEQPDVQVQVKADRFAARARTATPEEKPELWRHDGRDLAGLRRVPGQDRPRDPGGGARARRMTHVAEQLAGWAAGLEPSDDDLALAQRSLVDTLAVATAARAHPIARPARRALRRRGVGRARARPRLRRPAHGVDLARQRGVRARGARGRRRRPRLPGGGRGHGPPGQRAGLAALRRGLARDVHRGRTGRGRRGARRRWGSAPARSPRRWRSPCRRPAACSARSGRRPRRCRSASRCTPACAPRGWPAPARRPTRARWTSGSSWWTATRARLALGGPAVPGGLAVKLVPLLLRAAAPDRGAARARARRPRAGRSTRVVVRTPQSALAPLIHAAPTTGLEGKFSLQYAIAATLLDGRPGNRELHRRGRRTAGGAGAAGARRGRRHAGRRLAAGRRRGDRAHAGRRLDPARAARPAARRAGSPAVGGRAGREGGGLRGRSGRRDPRGRLVLRRRRSCASGCRHARCRGRSGAGRRKQHHRGKGVSRRSGAAVVLSGSLLAETASDRARKPDTTEAVAPSDEPRTPTHRAHVATASSRAESRRARRRTRRRRARSAAARRGRAGRAPRPRP